MLEGLFTNILVYILLDSSLEQNVPAVLDEAFIQHNITVCHTRDSLRLKSWINWPGCINTIRCISSKHASNLRYFFGTDILYIVAAR